MTFQEALSILFGGSASLHFLIKKLTLEKKSRVLINGASGEVGGIALQVMKGQGHHVPAVGSETSLKDLLELGADDFIDYRKQSLEPLAGQYDVIFDAVGKLDVNRVMRYLEKNGKFVTTQINAPVIKHLISGVLKGSRRIIAGIAGMDQMDVMQLINYYQVGVLKGRIDSVFSIEEMDLALERAGSGNKKGTVVVTMI